MNTFLLWVGAFVLLPFFLKAIIKRFFIILVLGLLSFYIITRDSLNNQKQLENFIEKSGVLFPQVVISQGILETGYFQSPIYKNNNNWLGLKCPTYRKKTYCKGTSRGHAVFSSTFDCLLEYQLWQKNTFRKEMERGNPLPNTNEEYIDLLVKYNYAEDPYYKDKLLKILQILKKLEK